jgi:hypothetical protein
VAITGEPAASSTTKRLRASGNAPDISSIFLNSQAEILATDSKTQSWLWKRHLKMEARADGMLRLSVPAQGGGTGGRSQAPARGLLGSSGGFWQSWDSALSAQNHLSPTQPRPPARRRHHDIRLRTVKHNGGAKPRISPSGMARAITWLCAKRAAEICGPIFSDVSNKNSGHLCAFTNSTAQSSPSPRTCSHMRVIAQRIGPMPPSNRRQGRAAVVHQVQPSITFRLATPAAAQMGWAE